MAAAAIRGIFTRCGFSANAAQTIYADHQLDDLDTIRELTDKDIDALAKTPRSPGGTIPNPVAGAAPANIPNPGMQVPARAIRNLKLVAYFLKHRERISRTTTAADILMADVRDLRHLRDEELNHEDPDTKIIVNEKNWVETTNSIQEHLKD